LRAAPEPTLRARRRLAKEKPPQWMLDEFEDIEKEFEEMDKDDMEWDEKIVEDEALEDIFMKGGRMEATDNDDTARSEATKDSKKVKKVVGSC